VDDELILVGDGGRIVRLEGEQIVDIMSGTRQNLRGISVNRINGTILVVGNEGTVVQLDAGASAPRVSLLGSQNLRAVSWNLDGTLALIAGNEGMLSTLSQETIHSVEGGRANFRHIAWRPNTNLALVTSNCFAEEFIPSPNLFSYDMETRTLSSLNEGRADLIGVDWKPDGTVAIVVGYDVIWHNGLVATYDGRNISPIEFPSKRVYPVAVSWNPKKEVAAIVTATAQPNAGQGILYLWNGKELRTIFRSKQFFFSAVAWNTEGNEVVALGSSATRTFNC
jgi:WD40 repeat protein